MVEAHNTMNSFTAKQLDGDEDLDSEDLDD